MKRFDEDFTPVDGSLLRHIISETDKDGEWPEKYKRLIIPYSLMSADLLDGQKKSRKRIPGLNDLDPAPFFDMVIVDEAHHLRNSTTQTHEAVKYFCEHANAIVFLTATPLQMGNKDLFTLLHLLRPDLIYDKASFDSMAEPNPGINTAIRYLRVPKKEDAALAALKSAAATAWGHSLIAPNPLYKNAVNILSQGETTRDQRVKLIHDIESLHSFANIITRTRRQDIEDFCIRRANTIPSTFTNRQKELHDELLNFCAAVLSVTHPGIPLKFLMCTLRRQAASCIFGLAPLIKDIVTRRLDTLFDDYEILDEIDGCDIDTEDFKTLAEKIINLAENLPDEDNKFDELSKIIVERQSLEKNKIIIFSTFRHTLKYLRKKINALGGIRVGYVDGSVKDDERYSMRERFELGKENPKALDVLLFTEIGSEGLDYQFCDTLVNYDIPWNPMRIEQRIGRIDRRGQESDVVFIFNCITHGTIDEEIYNRCLLRIDIFEHSIGDCADILGDLTKSIEDIILDTELTEEERSVKLEQLADNKIRKVQEMRRLEDDERLMFGIDVSGFINDVDSADNPWLAAESLRRLVYGYLDERLGQSDSRVSNMKLKLTHQDKTTLSADLNQLGNINVDNSWVRFLRSNSTVCNLTFNPKEAKDPKTMLLAPTHPLVRQAAAFYSTVVPFTTTIETTSTDIASGTYPFQFYIWEYTGDKRKTKLLPVCKNQEVQRELPAIMQNAITSSTTLDDIEAEWQTLEELHLNLWQSERAKYVSDIDSSTRFKIESLASSIAARKRVAHQQIDKTESDNIKIMRTGEIERLDREFAEKKLKLEEHARLADIHTTHIANGALVVRD
jgi:superfamily II DNA or RNA helicase